MATLQKDTISNFMRALLAILALFFSSYVAAQQPEPEYLQAEDSLALQQSRYRQTNNFPHHFKLQFAGSIGMLSTGFGYSYWKKMMDTDFYYGYVPARLAGGQRLHILTLKQTFSPFTVPVYKSFYLQPISAGLLGSYTLGDQFYLLLPAHYPKEYYWWSSGFRAGIFIGGSAGLLLPINKTFERLNLYYELGTNDLYLTSWKTNSNNKYLRIKDILTLGFGIKASF